MRQQLHSRAHLHCAFSFHLLDSHLQPKALIRLFAEHKMAVSETVSTQYSKMLCFAFREQHISRKYAMPLSQVLGYVINN